MTEQRSSLYPAQTPFVQVSTPPESTHGVQDLHPSGQTDDYIHQMQIASDLCVENTTRPDSNGLQHNDLTTAADCREWIAAYRSKAGISKLIDDTHDWVDMLQQSSHYISRILNAFLEKFDDKPYYGGSIDADDLKKYQDSQRSTFNKLKKSLEDVDVQKLAKAYSTIIFHAAVDLHMIGVKDDAAKQLEDRANGKFKSKAGMSSQYDFKKLIVDPLSCGDRIEAIAKSIQSNKLVAKGLLNGENLYELAANPKAVLLSKAIYKSSNNQRQKNLKESQELRDAAREATEEVEEPQARRQQASTSSVRSRSSGPNMFKKRRRTSDDYSDKNLAQLSVAASSEQDIQHNYSMVQPPALDTTVLDYKYDFNQHWTTGAQISHEYDHGIRAGDSSPFAGSYHARPEQASERPALRYPAADPCHGFQLPWGGNFQ